MANHGYVALGPEFDIASQDDTIESPGIVL